MLNPIEMPEEQRLEYWDRWFKRVRKEFCPLLLPFSGEPIVYVEIGCWAGASAEWVCKTVLTNSHSIGFGIDPYPIEPRHPGREIEAIKQRARTRVSEVVGDRWTWIEKPSSIGLLRVRKFLKGRSIDVLYIDGDHSGPSVVTDFTLAWPSLRPGSLVIFDDYWVGGTKLGPHVKEAYHSILTAWGARLKEVGKHKRQKAVIVETKELV